MSRCVMGRMMLIVASLEFLVNILVFYILHHGGADSLNLRSAALDFAIAF